MTDPERRRLIEQLCDAALDRDVSERAAFVAAASEGDEALRHEVEALLAHTATAEGFLDAPIGDVAAHVLANHDGRMLVGRQIGSHKILALLGTGGMGEVYRARDMTLGRDVAFKVVADGFLSDVSRLARFEREARVLATLNHPNIAAIYGVEEADGIRGLVLELVEGQTLAARVSRGPLAIPESLRIARQIADALEAAHDKGIIHRDLKPANIKITPDGTVKVLDFGLAKVLAPDGPGNGPVVLSTRADRTGEGVIAGTAAYMSPDQARGLPVDKRTDIWAFGCVVYQMLTGRAAFSGETFSDTIAKVLEREPDWNALPAQTPRSIRRLLQRCCEKDAKRRLRDISDARLEIDEALDPAAAPESPVTLEQAGRLPAARRARRRTWWAAFGTALLTFLILSGAALWYLQRIEYFWRNPLEGAKFTRLTDSDGTPHHAAISRDGKFVVYLRNVGGTWDAWVGQVGTGVFINLTNGQMRELRNPATRIFAFSPDAARVALWSRVADPVKGGVVNSGWAVNTLGGELQPYLKGLPGGLSELDWSPDEKHIVYHPPSSGDPLLINDLDGKDGRKIYEGRRGDHNHFPTWSPDGAFIYFVHGAPPPLDEMDIWRVPAAGGLPEQLTFHNARVSFPTFLDARTLLYLATDEDGSGPWIHVMDVATLRSRTVNRGIGEYTSLAANKDGSRLVATISRSSSTLWRVPIADRVVDESAAARVTLTTASGLSPRIGLGSIVYRAPIAGTNGLWKYSGGTSTQLWRGEGGALERAALSRDGQHLAVVVRRPGRWELYVINADGSGERRIAAELDVRGTPDWSPDGRWLAVAVKQGDDPHVFKIPVDGGPPVPLVKEYSLDPTWSPSGAFLVYSGADVGATFPVKAVNADGTPHDLPRLVLTRGERRLVFPSGREDALVVLMGDISYKEFSMFDLKTGQAHQLTKLGRAFAISDFDVSADGREIVFDRVREESDIVLIDVVRR